MPAARRYLLAAMMGIALLAIAGRAIAFPPGWGAYRGWRAYPPAVVIAPWPYPGAPVSPWALRVYDFRGLNPLPISPGAYRPPYGASWPGSSGGAYRPQPEAPRPAAPAPVLSSPAPPEGPEIVPAPPPAPVIAAPRSGPREF